MHCPVTGVNVRSDFLNLFFSSASMNPCFLLLLFLGMLFPGDVFARGGIVSEKASSAHSPDSRQKYNLSFSVRFVREFPFQRVRLFVDELDRWVFLTLFHEGNVARLDLETGQTLGTTRNIPFPESIAYNPVRHSILVALGDSRSYLVSPIGEDGPPIMDKAGLNPVWVGGAPALGYYLLAGAVHLLYSLGEGNYQITNWIALGDKVREVSFDPARKKIYLPLFRQSRIRTVSVPEFREIGNVGVDRCHYPKFVLSDGKTDSEGVLVLCRNGLFGGDAVSGGFGTIKRFGERPGMMARIGRSNLIAISFPDAHEIRVFDQKRNQIVKAFPTRGRPVFLSAVPMKNDLLVVSNRPARRVTQVILYRFRGSALASRTRPSGLSVRVAVK